MDTIPGSMEALPGSIWGPGPMEAEGRLFGGVWGGRSPPTPNGAQKLGLGMAQVIILTKFHPYGLKIQTFISVFQDQDSSWYGPRKNKELVGRSPFPELKNENPENGRTHKHEITRSHNLTHMRAHNFSTMAPSPKFQDLQI